MYTPTVNSFIIIIIIIIDTNVTLKLIYHHQADAAISLSTNAFQARVFMGPAWMTSENTRALVDRATLEPTVNVILTNVIRTRAKMVDNASIKSTGSRANAQLVRPKLTLIYIFARNLFTCNSWLVFSYFPLPRY